MYITQQWTDFLKYQCFSYNILHFYYSRSSEVMKFDYICVFYYFLMLSFFKTFNLMSTDFALIALSLNSAGSVFRLTFM